jgi:signal peptidase I
MSDKKIKINEEKQNIWSLIRETAILLIVAYVLALIFQAFLYQPFKVEQGSMTPTLIEGQRIFVSKIGYRFGSPHRGDIVTLRSPKEPPMMTLRLGLIPVKEKRTLVKRIIGLPGETIKVEDGKTYINGKILSEDYVKFPDYTGFGPYKVPKNHYFAMGDNRANSRDSRDLAGIGPIPAENIIGKALIVYWPLNKIHILH